MIGKCNTGGENVKAEVTAQVPIIQGIAENLGVTITTPSGTNKRILQGNNANLLNIKNNAKKEGLYVWKKYQYTPEESVSGLSFDMTYTRLSDAYISNQNYDISRIPKNELVEFYNGFVGEDGTTLVANGDNTIHFIRYSSDVATATYVGHDKITISGSFGGTNTYKYTCSTPKTLPAAIGDFIDFVVSDSETTYPDGGEQGGYWYEKVVEGIDFGEITLATEQETVTVAHKLGIIPSFVALVPKSVPSSLPSKCIYLVANNTAFYGAGGLVKGGFSPTKTDTQITFGSIYISGYGVNTAYPAWDYYWFAIT